MARSLLSPRIISGLDAVRSFAAIYIVFHHLAGSRLVRPSWAMPFRFGQEAVVIFLLLSGFLIYANEHERAFGSGLRNYYRRRIERLYPPLLCALVVSALVAIDDHAFIARFSWRALLGSLACLQDISALKPGVIVDPFMGNDPLWSLSYEAGFYLAFPAVLWWRGREGVLADHLIGGCCCLAYLSYILYPNHISLVAAYLLVWWAGAMAAEAYVRGRHTAWGIGPTLVWLAILCGLAAVVVSLVGARGAGRYPVLPLRHFAIGLAMLLAFYGPLGAWVAARTLPAARVSKVVASMSYGIYLFHFPLLVQWHRAQGVVGLAGAAGLLVFLAWVADRNVRQWMRHVSSVSSGAGASLLTRMSVRSSSNEAQVLLGDASGRSCVTDVYAIGAGLAIDLSNRSIPDECDRIQTSGFAVVGRGAAQYARTSSPSSDEQVAGTNHWLFQTNGASVWWRLDEDQPTDLMFGVTADAIVTYASDRTKVEGTDDSLALQAAFDYIAYFAFAGSSLRIPAGLRKTTRTLQLGYGDLYVSWQFLGDAQGFGRTSYDDDGTMSIAYTSGIFPTFSDRMVINIAGARGCRFEGIQVFGLNHAWLLDHLPETNPVTRSPTPGPLANDRTTRANWFGPQLNPDRNSTNAPYAGIAIDGYGGSCDPASHYPPRFIPSWVRQDQQYNAGTSSDIAFKQVTCQGFEVNHVVQPNAMLAASNGDFMRYENCTFQLGVHALSISQSDSRSIVFNGGSLGFCWASFDNVTYGSQTGNAAAVFTGVHLDNSANVLFFDLGIVVQSLAPPITFIDCYAEAIYSLGTLRARQIGGKTTGCLFQGCQFGFFVRNGENSPPRYLDAYETTAVEFKDVTINGTYGVFPVGGTITAENCVLPTVTQQVFEQADFDPPGRAGRRALSFLSGIYAPSARSVRVRPFSFFSHSGEHLLPYVDDDRFDITAGQPGGYARGLPIPWFVRALAFDGLAVPIAGPATQMLDRAAHPFSGLTKSGIDWSGTVSIDFLADADRPGYCIGLGDVVTADDGTLLYVKGVTFSGSGSGTGGTTALILRQITGVYCDYVNRDTPIWSTSYILSPNAGKMTFLCSRRFYPGQSRRLMMTTTADDPTANLSAIGPETIDGQLGTTGIQTLLPGDFLLASARESVTLEQSVFLTGTIVDVDLTSGAVQLSGAARHSGVFYAPLMIKSDLS